MFVFWTDNSVWKDENDTEFMFEAKERCIESMSSLEIVRKLFSLVKIFSMLFKLSKDKSSSTMQFSELKFKKFNLTFYNDLTV